MEARDELILTHIGLYRVTLRKVIEKLFLEGRDSGNVLQRLMDSGHVQKREGLPGRVSYYQLTSGEAIARGLPVGRSGPLKSQALRQHLGVLWFCTMDEVRRHRLEVEELLALDPGMPSQDQAAHCVEQGKISRVWRLETIGPKTGVGGLVARLTKRVHEARNHPTLGVWVKNRQYAFAVLVEEEGRRKLIDHAIEAKRLKSLAHVAVFYAPGHRTIGDALNGRRR